MLEFQIPSDEIIASMQPDDIARLKAAAEAWDHLQARKREEGTAGDAVIATAQAFEDAKAAIPKRRFINDLRDTWDRPPVDEVIEEPAPELPQGMHSMPAATGTLLNPTPIVEQIVGDHDKDDYASDPVHRRRR